MVKNILVVVEDYPSKDNAYPMAYVHTRNKIYLSKNSDIKITVLSFKCKKSYIWDGLQVYSEKEINKLGVGSFDIFVSHAPNIKNHIRFFNKNKIKNITFFIHGHEVLNVSKYYPKPYSWDKDKNMFLRKIYDYFKLKIISNFFVRNEQFKFIFVSRWMEREALKNLGIKKLRNTFVIHNPINEEFGLKSFNSKNEKKYDFITIRPLDGPKYCLDIVYKLAKNYPEFRFKIIGKGNFFKYNPQLDNIDWDSNFYSPSDLIEKLDEARFALMPTRLDSQGVMMCELASYGMPIITSDIPICYEMLEGYNLSYFINNENPDLKFKDIISKENFDISKEVDRSVLLRRFNIQSISHQELKVILDI